MFPDVDFNSAKTKMPVPVAPPAKKKVEPVAEPVKVASSKEKKRATVGSMSKADRVVSKIDDHQEEPTKEVLHPLDLVIQKKQRNKLRRGYSRALSQIDRKGGETTVNAVPAGSSRSSLHHPGSNKRQPGFGEGRKSARSARSHSGAGRTRQSGTPLQQQQSSSGQARNSSPGESSKPRVEGKGAQHRSVQGKGWSQLAKSVNS